MNNRLERRVARLEQKTGMGEPTYFYVHTGVGRFEGATQWCCWRFRRELHPYLGAGATEAKYRKF